MLLTVSGRWWTLLFLLAPRAAIAVDVSGYVAWETRFFIEAPLHQEQGGSIWSPSIVLQPEFTQEFNGGKDRLTAIPFLRGDANQQSRNHFDMRELSWVEKNENYDFRVGISKVFWGVAESRHLVDIVNQTDQVENMNEEIKLGQPMLNYNQTGEWGNLSLFLLPAFRERTFIGRGDRLRYLLPVDDSHVAYESSLKNRHPDLAGRWSKTFGDWDVGISQFWGTGREPRLVVNTNDLTLGPRYDIINQTGLDVQAALGNWLLKLEAITRGGQGKRFGATVAGFEYTFYKAFESSYDLGILSEYIYDGRDNFAPPAPFKDDFFLGIRLNLNDEQNSEFLAGGIIDRKTAAATLSLEANRRVGSYWKISVEARMFKNAPQSNLVLYGLRNDDYFQFSINRYF
jgi:hypothetical protein